MGKLSVEDIKKNSRSLRGKITETMESGASHFDEAEYQLLKFHGTYQQDDRDLRKERRAAKEEPAYSFMVRSKVPGGVMTPEQYLMHERVCDQIGNGTMRITTRQGFQFHGILIGDLKQCMQEVHNSGLTTWGACGDVVRNTMASPSPIKDEVHADMQGLAEEISTAFLARGTAFSEIWLDGEKVEVEVGEPEVEDPIYGRVYLPRKFKMGIAAEPRNDVDLYSQDVGFVPYAPAGKVEGYTILVGGGFGMSHGQTKTYPVLAKPLFYVKRENVVEATKAIVTTQRDFGNREDRKQSRMKYLIETKGLSWFRQEVESRVDFKPEEAKELNFDTVADNLGWHEQGDGNWFVGVWVPQGRVLDTDSVKFRTAFRKLTEEFGLTVALTPNTNILFTDIPADKKDAVQKLLEEHGITAPETLTAARQTGHACVALPTCGLSLSESERVFGDVMDEIDTVLRELNMQDEPLLIRMSGCPNGCSRPYNSDIAFVGRGPQKYAMYVGGSSSGQRLAGLYKKTVKQDEIQGEVRALLEDFGKTRNDSEIFTDWYGRTQEMGPAPDPEQFHVELTERDEKRAAEKAGS